MYYKKVWVIILIIVVVSSLIPSILIAKAEDEPPETPVDRDYDFSNAPYPGDNGYMTEARWNAFIEKAKEYQHQVIYEFLGYELKWESGPDTYSTNRVFFSAPLGGYDEYLNIEPRGNNRVSYEYRLSIAENVEVNKIPINGQDIDSRNIASVFGSRFGNLKSHQYFMNIYYIADLEDDPYQEKPELYNIDPQKGYGMYFVKP